MFKIERCKREQYIKAWNYMYLNDKKKFNQKMFLEVNPSLNKFPLKTELENYCVVVYDSNKKVEDFEFGCPVGLFCFVVTQNKIIGKQFIVHPDYQGLGLGKALLIENEKVLKENGYNKYYIGCSKYSSAILKKWGLIPFSEDIEKDMFKFNVDLNRENFNLLYKNIILNNNLIEVI